MGRHKKEEPKPRKYEAVEEIRRKKSSSYRPSELMASVDEAKDLLRKRYETLGIEVVRVSRFSVAWFTVSFKDGKGPSGLESILCNWPYIEGAENQAEAEALLKKQKRAAGKEAPDMKAIMKDPKKRKRFMNEGFEGVEEDK